MGGQGAGLDQVGARWGEGEKDQGDVRSGLEKLGDKGLHLFVGLVLSHKDDVRVQFLNGGQFVRVKRKDGNQLEGLSLSEQVSDTIPPDAGTTKEERAPSFHLHFLCESSVCASRAP